MLTEPAIKKRYEVLGIEAASATPEQMTAADEERDRAVAPDHQGRQHQGRVTGSTVIPGRREAAILGEFENPGREERATRDTNLDFIGPSR